MAGVSDQQFITNISRALGTDRARIELPDPVATRTVASDASPADLFATRAEQAGMHVLRTSSPTEVRNRVSRIAHTLEVRSVLFAGPPTPADDLIVKDFKGAGIPMLDPADPDSPFNADMSVTGVHAAIAETGSLVICAEPGSPRLASLAVPVHVAVVAESQILPDLLDWADWQQTVAASTGQVLISGPSKTADIELNLVTGVHGPGEVHVILLATHV